MFSHCRQQKFNHTAKPTASQRQLAPCKKLLSARDESFRMLFERFALLAFPQRARQRGAF
jgi:hypothetical protein